MSTIIGRRNTWIQEYRNISVHSKEWKAKTTGQRSCMVFTVFPEAFEDAVLARYQSCLFLGAVVGTPEISNYLNSPPYCMPGPFLAVSCSLFLRWVLCRAGGGVQVTVPLVYTDTTPKWQSGELRWSNEHWNEGISLDYRVDPSSLCPLSGQAQGLCMLISFSCGWFSWHEALEDTLRSWWCFGKLWVKYEAMNIRREKVKEQSQEI